MPVTVFAVPEAGGGGGPGGGGGEGGASGGGGGGGGGGGATACAVHCPPWHTRSPGQSVSRVQAEGSTHCPFWHERPPLQSASVAQSARAVRSSVVIVPAASTTANR